jgi:23S rRNA (adenine2503-C2)-methyltransferase
MVEEIRQFTLEELEARFKDQGVEVYRARQVFQWLYQKGCVDFDRMTNLSKDLKEILKRYYAIAPVVPEKIVTARDLTQKFLFRLEDGAFIEAVSIPEKARLTVCLSTQVGCKYACAFCASGSTGFKRHLTAAEIVGELVEVRRHVPGERLTNVVFMGVGEPLDNYDNLLRAIRIMHHPQGINLGARKMTISTVGLIPGIERLAQEGLQLELSVSLHAATDAKRTALLPVNAKYPLSQLIPSVRDYAEVTKRKITFEYILLGGYNTSVEDAQALIKLVRGVHHRVNLIPYNETAARGAFQAPTKLEVLFFQNTLKKYGLDVMVRRSRGADVDAACGQLRGNAMKTKGA